MGHRKGAGSTKNGWDSNSKRLHLLQAVVTLYRLIDQFEYHLDGYDQLYDIAGLLVDVRLYL